MLECQKEDGVDFHQCIQGAHHKILEWEGWLRA